jgi:hypothetical protein
MDGMSVKKAAKRKRRYLSSNKRWTAETVFLVYVYDTHASVLQSDGPYEQHDEATMIMRQKLSEGICSWIVSYDG